MRRSPLTISTGHEMLWSKLCEETKEAYLKHEYSHGRRWHGWYTWSRCPNVHHRWGRLSSRWTDSLDSGVPLPCYCQIWTGAGDDKDIKDIRVSSLNWFHIFSNVFYESLSDLEFCRLRWAYHRCSRLDQYEKWQRHLGHIWPVSPGDAAELTQ